MKTKALFPRLAVLALFLATPPFAHAAVTVNGTATVSNIGNGGNIGSGAAKTFNYTCPAGTVGLVMVEASNSGAPAVPTAFSYNGVAATLIPNTFVGAGAGEQVSMWYLPSPPTGTSDIVSITYTQSVTGGAAAVMIPLLGVSTGTPYQTTTSANNATGTSTTAAVTPPAATANDLYVAIAGVDGTPTVTVATGTQLTNTNSRGSMVIASSDLAGNGGALSWTLSVSSAWTMSAVAFLAPTSSCTNNFWPSTGAWAVPNGTTGSYWSTTGAFLTPNCSTGSFWLKSGAIGSN